MVENELARLVAAAVTALAVLLLILAWLANRSGSTAQLWVSSALAGVLLGVAGTMVTIKHKGYSILKVANEEPAEANNATAGPGGGGAGGGGMMGMMMGGPPSGKSGGGFGGGGGGFGGGGGQPSPKAQLTSLVRKLEILTGDVAIQLSAEQKTNLGKELADLEADKMSDDDAKKKLDAINALLDEPQRAKQEAIGLPRPVGRAGGGGGGGGFGGGGGGGGFGGPPPDPTANPFAETNTLKALKSLRSRL